MANLITAIRIVCSAALLFFPAFSPAFYVLYIAAGASDMIDGAVARKTGSVSEFGSRLDTAADFIMAAFCFIKLVPALDFEIWTYVWIGIIAMIKVINVASGFTARKRFVAVHSVMNKVTGGLLFILPLTVKFIDFRYGAAVVCAVATFAAVQEGHYIRTSKDKKHPEKASASISA